MSEHDNTSELSVFEGGWTKCPAFFVDDLMPLAVGVPASFWKYLLVVWRDCFGKNSGYRCRRTMTQFHVSKDTALKWTAALSVSCLFQVRYGVRHKLNEPGLPTVIEYRPDSTQEDWRCFITALQATILDDKRKHFDDVEGLRIGLAFELQKERDRAGLPAAEIQKFIERQVAAGKVQIDEGNGGYVWQARMSDRRGLMTAAEREYWRGDTRPSGCPPGTFDKERGAY